MARTWAQGDSIINSSITLEQNATLATVSLWVRTTRVPTTAMNLLSTGGGINTGAFDNGRRLSIRNASGVGVFSADGASTGAQGVLISGTTTVTDGNWHHFGLSYGRNSGNTWKLYTDGVLQASAQNTQTLSNTSTFTHWPDNQIVIGQPQGYDTEFSGDMCELTVWLTILNDSEIAQLARGVQPYLIRNDPANNSPYIWIPNYGLSGASGAEANYGASYNGGGGAIFSISGTTYQTHAPVTQLDLGFPGTIGFMQITEAWTGTFAKGNFSVPAPVGYADWAPPSV